MDAKVGHFQCKLLRLLAVALIFCRVAAVLGVSTPSIEMSTSQKDKPTESSCPIVKIVRINAYFGNCDTMQKSLKTRTNVSCRFLENLLEIKFLPSDTSYR
jgi:hypothetical protein